VIDWGIDMFSRKSVAAIAVGVTISTSLMAQEDGEIISTAFTLGGVEKSFSQGQTLDTETLVSFHRKGADCDQICIAPEIAADGVQTVGERDVIAFVASTVSAGNGLLIDSREPDQRAAGYISGSVSVPTSLVQSDNPYLTDIMLALGARALEGTLNYSDAMPLIVFDDGPTTFDAPALIAQLIAQGYPAEKISYYHGGMLVWTALGLNTEDANS